MFSDLIFSWFSLQFVLMDAHTVKLWRKNENNTISNKVTCLLNWEAAKRKKKKKFSYFFHINVCLQCKHLFCCVCKYNYRLSWGCQEPPQATTGTYEPWKQAPNAMSWGWIGRILRHLSFTSWLHSWETSGKSTSLSNSVLPRLGSI